MQRPRPYPRAAGSTRPKRPHRGFLEVPVTAVGYQSGSERFPLPSLPRDADVQDRDEPPPFLEVWRNNLTALSHSYNLYVVACEDELHVYQPQFPDQKFTGQAALVIPLPKTGLGLPGNFRHSKPHAVNHLLIADLGREEIVLCACDDGDVIAYWTRALHNAILRTQEEDDVMGDTVDEIKPMFHQNVGESAWGLAVHKEARKVAVSANTAEITVFEFALAQDEEEDRDNGIVHGKGVVKQTPLMEANRKRLGKPRNLKVTDSHCKVPQLEVLEEQHTHEEWAKPSDNARPGRTRNVRVTLAGMHPTNIPCIAFCNTPEDPDGEVLVSADIRGHTILWDIKTGKPLSSLVPTDVPGLPIQHGQDERRAVWGVMWLDKRAFTRTASLIHAMGTATKMVRHQDKIVADISASKLNVRNVGSWGADDVLRGFTNAANRHLGRDANINAEVNDDENNDENDNHNNNDNPPTPSTQLPTAFEDLDLGTNTPPHLLTPASSTGTSSPSSTDSHFHQDLSSRPLADLLSAANAYTWPILTFSGTNNFISPAPHVNIPRDPFLLVNPHTATLLQSANFSCSGGGRGNPFHPAIFLDEPLTQPIDLTWHEILEDLDRMNMSCVIPELGVVLLGSPKGRVAVLTLHLLEAHGGDGGGGRSSSGPGGSVRASGRIWERDRGRDKESTGPLPRPSYSMRLDHILPFNTQEKRGQRPPQVLVGLAAGPVQGCWGGGGGGGGGGASYAQGWGRPAAGTADTATGVGHGHGHGHANANDLGKTRKWRVMLLYRDHTVLSYEIGRAIGGGGGVGRGRAEVLI